VLEAPRHATVREPKIVAYATHDPERQRIITIRVKNIGNDVARGIVFTASRPIQQAFGLSEGDAEPPETMTHGPLIDGIPLLAPGESRDITWGQFGGLMKAVGREPIHLTFTNQHGRRELIGDPSWKWCLSVGPTIGSNLP
jgi:hypothetical protein